MQAYRLAQYGFVTYPTVAAPKMTFRHQHSVWIRNGGKGDLKFGLAWGAAVLGVKQKMEWLGVRDRNLKLLHGAPSSHTKGCPQNAPHSLNPPPSSSLFGPHRNVLWVFPAHTPTHMLTHRRGNRSNGLQDRSCGECALTRTELSEELRTVSGVWDPARKKPLTRFKQPQG